MDMLLQGASAEVVVKSSRFIAETFPVTGAEDAREQLRLQKARYHGASHVVHAFVAGRAAELRGMSDDGEPPGTAARPIMDILAGRRVTGILLTVTRYFGGTLLGTGGLVRAYGDAARAVLPRCRFIPWRTLVPYECTVPYEHYAALRRRLEQEGAEDIQADFGTEVRLRCLVRGE
jgi:uncharacterized YigZ family protein